MHNLTTILWDLLISLWQAHFKPCNIKKNFVPCKQGKGEIFSASSSWMISNQLQTGIFSPQSTSFSQQAQFSAQGRHYNLLLEDWISERTLVTQLAMKCWPPPPAPNLFISVRNRGRNAPTHPVITKRKKKKSQWKISLFFSCNSAYDISQAAYTLPSYAVFQKVKQCNFPNLDKQTGRSTV